MKAKRKHPESDLQSQVVGILQTYENMGRLTFFAVPNGLWIAGGSIAERSKRIAIMKRKGALRPGAPDLIVCLAGGQFGAIELKAKRGTLTDEQEQFRDRIRTMCGLWALCRSLDDVKGVLDAWTLRRAA